jgi:REP element-mobilizing transposase RayT
LGFLWFGICCQTYPTRFLNAHPSILAKLKKVFEKARSENRSQDVSQYQVWQEGSHPEAIFTEKFARQKLDYIHMNPVRAGLVEAPEQWLYSSARAYYLGEKTYPPTDILVTG